MIYVCDAIMGSGKSSAAITYMNEHPEQKYIYITPYLEEAARIKAGCPELHFVEPSDKIKELGFSKTNHTASLVEQGRNVATTHEAFKGYPPELIADIRRGDYVLIIDENVDVLESFKFHPSDLQMAVDAGYIKEEDGVYSIIRDGYDGKALRDMFKLLRSRELIKVRDKKNEALYWVLPPQLISAFKEVFILTYLFEGQSIHHFLKIYGLPYKPIGIERTPDGGYRFGKYPGYTPEYVANIKNVIHILDNSKLNTVGDGRTDLSMAWFERGGENVETLKNNVSNCFTHLWRDSPSGKRLWGTYKFAEGKIRGKGYTKNYVTFNMKATNKYKHCDHLVYIVNTFMNVAEKTFYEKHGIDVDEDMYALSIMVQWIWRSAIREGEDVYIYIPSRRMRELLIGWMNGLCSGTGEDRKENGGKRQWTDIK